jgi:hypothetical protein
MIGASAAPRLGTWEAANGRLGLTATDNRVLSR